MWAIVWGFIVEFVKLCWEAFVPNKTAADQEVEDMKATLKEANYASNITEKVSRESDSDLDADLSKHLHGPTD